MTRLATHCLPFLIAAFVCLTATAQTTVNWKKVSVLVYTKNGKGYVHDNISEAKKAIQRMGAQHGFRVDTSSSATIFSEDNLRRYTLLLFLNTNNDVFDTDAQRLVFRRYIEAGGGFVGVHSVLGTERNWPWFKQLLGGTFAWHPKFQPLKMTVLDSHHPSMQGLPATWNKSDECYFIKEMTPGPTVLLAHNLAGLNPDETEKITANRGMFTNLYPAAWAYAYDGGHSWCTTLGHDKKDYTDPTYVNHLFQGIRFVAGQVKMVDFNRAYANGRDEAVRY
ncbi:ThuA domain-containing protein [Fibrella sp. HMF5335]|uniref:ThuA domain-containing protein n=1 Tax=Fibrella rubiginis TaxID=2817060 RepID=A0A939GH87_9BACT|nr:ThuA domain-containing protein [Fibrella rubiginis]MBO0938296.1 ThuA domain-containing protein [Fibrella rubiginis]